MKRAIEQIIVRGRRHLLLMFVLAAFTPPLASALKVRDEPVPSSDIALLPPVCKLILVEHPGAHLGAGNGPLQKYVALFEQPGYEMAAHNPHLHHYCWALISKQRYFRAQGQIQREYYFKQFMGDIGYVLTNTADKKWPYFHVLLIEQASMLKIRGDYPNSLMKIDEALRFKPDYDKAYALKSDIFLAMGDRKKAIDTVQSGLEQDPRSRLLRRRLEQLGVKVPPLPDPVPDDAKENASNAESAGSPVAGQQEKVNGAADGSSMATPPISETPNIKETGQGMDSKMSSPTGADAAGKNQDKPVTGTGSLPDKAYCRFCP